MKGFTKIMLIIASVAIGILVIVVASVAWFTSNPETDVSDVSLSAANTLNVAFDSNLYKSGYSYDGQTGLAPSGDDAPYIYEFGYFKVNLMNSSSEKRSVVKIEFSTVDMICAICEVKDLLITDLFRVQIACYVEDATGGYKKEDNVFLPQTNGGYRLIANDYTLDADSYLYRAGSRAQLPEGVYYVAFTYIFLPAIGGGYVQDDDGTYIGQVSYKAISGSNSYDYSNGAYVQDDGGNYTKMITSYVSSVTRYAYDGEHYEVSPTGSYIKVKDHLGNDLNEYVEFDTFKYVAGFPFADICYQGAKYVFSIVCSVEEV